MNWRRGMQVPPAGGGAPAAGRMAAVLALVAALPSLPGWTAVPAASGQTAQQPMSIMMTVACVEAGEEGAFHLIRATEPEAIADRLPPQPESSVALGGHRIRLIGTLDEFGVARHAGHKVWAKGLLIEDESERRLNLVSITRLSADCE